MFTLHPTLVVALMLSAASVKAKSSQVGPPLSAEDAAEAVPLPPVSIDWRLAGGGVTLLIAAGVIVARRRGRRSLVVDLVLDDAHDGRFAIAVAPEKTDSVLGEIQLRLGQNPPAQLESGLSSLPPEITSRFQAVSDGVRVSSTFTVRGGDRLRLLCFGRSAARSDLSLQMGGGLAVSSVAGLRAHVQERLVQILDDDLTVTFDLRASKFPLRVSRPPVPLGGPEPVPEGSSPPRPLSRGTMAAAPAAAPTTLPRVGAAPLTSAAISLAVPALPGAPTAPGVTPMVVTVGGVPTTAGAALLAGALPSEAELAKRARADFLEGKYEEAAVTYGQLNDLENQARCYLFLGQTERVAQIDAKLAYQRRDLESAVNHYLRAKDFASAARVLRELGRSKEAFRVEADAKAAAGQLAEAAAGYQRAGDLTKAAEMLLQMGSTVRAAELYAQAEAFADAARLFAGQGDLARAADLFQKAKLPAEAALVLYKMGRRDEALALAEQVSPVDPKALAAANVLARAYAELGRAADLSALANRISSPQAGTGDPEMLYSLAMFFESKGLVPESIGTLERLQSVQADFKDVPGRLARLQAALKGRTPSGSAATYTRPAIVSGNATSADIRGASETSVDLAPITGPLKPVSTGLPQGTQRYRIDAELGRGAMGIVYKGTDTLLGRPVAVKTLPRSLAADPRLSRMFLDEARSLAALNHPHIVQIFDMGEMDGTMFLAMEFVTGETLEKVVEREGKLPVKTALGLIDQVAQALESAHGHGVVHRDIKPANVMVGTSGAIKLMDFGIAAAGEGAQQAGERLGTPYYMSPEQALGKPVDGRSDLYALGVVLYRLISGSVPFDSGDILMSHVNVEPPPLAQRAPGSPPAVVALVEAMMAKDPANRPATATELRARLSPLLAS